MQGFTLARMVADRGTVSVLELIWRSVCSLMAIALAQPRHAQAADCSTRQQEPDFDGSPIESRNRPVFDADPKAAAIIAVLHISDEGHPSLLVSVEVF
jgi:hypothetical protein